MDHSSRDLLTVSLMNIGDKELNSVVCAAYKMGCDQTREIYQKRVEKLEAALQRANATAEEYERKFYLGSDRIEQLEEALREIVNKDLFSMDWAIRTARNALDAK